MNRLKARLRAKFPGGSSRLNHEIQGDDEFMEPGSTAASVQLPVVLSPPTRAHDGLLTVGAAESQNAIMQRADPLVSRYESAYTTRRHMLLIE